MLVSYEVKLLCWVVGENRPICWFLLKLGHYVIRLLQGFCIWVRWKLVSDCQEVLLVTVRCIEVM